MTIQAGTNSYLTLAELKAWLDLRNLDYSGFTDDEINAALVVSSIDFIDPNYNFKGDKFEIDQSMDLPTDEVTISDIVNGAAQAAWQELNGELFISPSANSSGQILKTKEKLDVLEEEVEYAEGSAHSYKHDTTKIDRFLAPFTVGNVGGRMGRTRNC